MGLTHIFGRVSLSAPTFHLISDFVSSRIRTLYFMIVSHPSWSLLSIMNKVSTNLSLTVLVSPLDGCLRSSRLSCLSLVFSGMFLSIHLFAVEGLICFPFFILVTAPLCMTCDVEYIRPSSRSCESQGLAYVHVSLQLLGYRRVLIPMSLI